jgi:very-short-patch-repair endonuclease
MTNANARNLRNNPADAERRLWNALRGLKPHGTHFRRQVPIGAYIADFCCHSLKLII